MCPLAVLEGPFFLGGGGQDNTNDTDIAVVDPGSGTEGVLTLKQGPSDVRTICTQKPNMFCTLCSPR